MLSLFPGLLFLAPLATALIRAAAGLMFMYMALRMAITREHISQAKVVLIGHIPEWLVWIAVVVTFVAGVLLFVGLWTQGAAIVGMLIAIKHGLGVRKYRNVLPLAGSAYLLLFVICLSLLFSGAGAFAFDLPL